MADDAVLVQTGDIVDRGPDTVALLDLFTRLKVCWAYCVCDWAAEV
jgi:hypothetical protein